MSRAILRTTSRRVALLVTVLFMLSSSTVGGPTRPEASAAPGSILVVSPHPDDDLLAAAGIISAAITNGDTATTVYLTNGDFDSVATGLIRQNEAVTAQVTHLGAAENDLIFLGYPDGSLFEIISNYPDASDVFTAPNGQSMTYGTRGLGGKDYHSHAFGSPADYNMANIIQDLTSILQTYRPTDIYGLSEFDLHGDHSTAYYLLNLALADAIAADPTYSPVVHTTIVWSSGPGSWPEPADPSAIHVPIPGLDDTDLLWGDRQSIIVPVSMQATNLSVNPKWLAIDGHASQGGAGGFLGKFVHKDEIFWAEAPSISNQRPFAIAGPNQTLGVGMPVELDGTGSFDLDGDPLTYSWTQTGGPTVTLSDATSAAPTFTAPVTGTTLTFDLVVNDGTETSQASSTTVTIDDSNIAGLATASANSEATGQEASKAIDGIADGWPTGPTNEWSTVGGGVGSWLELNWASPVTIDQLTLYDRPNLSDHMTAAEIQFNDGSTVAVGSLVNDGSPTTVPVPTKTITSLRVTVTAVAGSTSSIGLAEIGVRSAPNTAPTVAITSPPDGTVVDQGDAVTLVGTASDVEDGDLTASISWTSDVDGPLGTGASITPVLSSGAHTVTASATDAGGMPGSDILSLRVNMAPAATYAASCVELECLFTDSSTDVDGSVVSWSWDLGDGNASSAAGPLVHTYASGGTYAITLTVTDSDGAVDTAAKNVTVESSGGGGPSFIDTATSAFIDDIEWLAAEGITRGCNPPKNDRFCPDDPVTRGQMAAFLVRALGLTDGLSDPFVDDNGSIFEADIERLAAAGITRGCNPPKNDRFCPDDPVTRGQMAAFLHRGLG